MNFEQILALLMGKFSGVRKDALAQMARTFSLTATTEDEAKGLVEKLTPDQVNAFAKDYRKDVDKEVSESNKTYETNLKKKYDFKEKTNPEPGNPEPGKPDPNDIASIVKAAVAEAVKPFQDKLSGFEGQKITETRLQTLEGKLKDVPETLKAQKLKDFKRMNFDTDESFTEYLTETEAGITAFNQEMANKGLGMQGRPMFGQKNTDGVSAAVSQFIEEKKKPELSLGGKEV